MSVDAVEAPATTTPLVTPAAGPATTDPATIADVTTDTRRPLPKPARKRVAHRLVAAVITQALESGGFDHGLESYIEADVDEIVASIEEIAKDHERRSL